MTPSNANTRLRPNSYRSRNQAASSNLSLSLGQGQGQAGGLYQCSRCDRCYNRTEHLARHVRSHTKQRPYSCSFCTKAFARMDILKRHQATHSRPQHELDSLQQSGQDYRVSRACRLAQQQNPNAPTRSPVAAVSIRAWNAHIPTATATAWSRLRWRRTRTWR